MAGVSELRVRTDFPAPVADLRRWTGVGDVVPSSVPQLVGSQAWSTVEAVDRRDTSERATDAGELDQHVTGGLSSGFVTKDSVDDRAF